MRKAINVLLIGSGGREHALARAIAKSTVLTKLFIAPGNPETAECGENVVVNVADYAAVIRFCKLMGIGFLAAARLAETSPKRCSRPPPGKSAHGPADA